MSLTSSSQSMQPASTANVAVGTFVVDTAAATTITLGFQARYIRVQNITASTGLVKVEWYEGMGVAGIKTALNGTQSVLSTTGITVAATTFIIGLDTDLLATTETCYWIAIG